MDTGGMSIVLTHTFYFDSVFTAVNGSSKNCFLKTGTSKLLINFCATIGSSNASLNTGTSNVFSRVEISVLDKPMFESFLNKSSKFVFLTLDIFYTEKVVKWFNLKHYESRKNVKN